MSRWSYQLPILGYHRIGEFKGDHVPTVSPEAFKRQLDTLARHRYRVLGLDEFTRLLDEGGPLPRRSVVITFDDGYEETHSIAWPLLKQLGFPAAVFVTPAEVGLPGFAGWEQLIEMAGNGMLIGNHTMHHSYLPAVKEDHLAEELIESKYVIEERLGRPIYFLSYPIGGFTAQAQALAKQTGYLAACTTNRTSPLAGIDRFALRRIKVTERDRHSLIFLAKLCGYYDAFRRLRHPG